MKFNELYDWIVNCPKPFLYDAISEYEDFITLYDVVEGKEELPEKPLLVLTYLYNELDNYNYIDRAIDDRDRLKDFCETKIYNSPEKDDAKYLIVGDKGENIDLPLQDSRLTRKHKIWYAEQLEKFVDPQFLRRNYRLKNKRRRIK